MDTTNALPSSIDVKSLMGGDIGTILMVASILSIVLFLVIQIINSTRHWKMLSRIKNIDINLQQLVADSAARREIENSKRRNDDVQLPPLPTRQPVGEQSVEER